MALMSSRRDALKAQAPPQVSAAQHPSRRRPLRFASVPPVTLARYAYQLQAPICVSHILLQQSQSVVHGQRGCWQTSAARQIPPQQRLLSQHQSSWQVSLTAFLISVTCEHMVVGGQPSALQGPAL